MAFQITTPTAATLRTVTPRTKIHGDLKVSAISLGLSITGPNTLLDALDGGKLRNALYMAAPDQDQLPGVEPGTPLLRARGIELVKLTGTLEGWTVRFEHGIDDDSAIVLGGSKVDAFRCRPMEGGSVELLFRVGTSDISETEGGALFGMLGQEVMLTITAPVVATGAPIIDGSAEAFKRDHPEFADGADAGDLFAQQHGGEAGAGDDGASDQHAGDFGAADDDSAGPGAGSSDDAPFGEAQRGEDWPFPQGDGATGGEGGDAGGDAAEFEAGAAAALAKAGVAPRGRRERKTAGAVE